jgi:3-hydroxyacyl-[acyl-carrier-protein] dehydratase
MGLFVGRAKEEDIAVPHPASRSGRTRSSTSRPPGAKTSAATAKTRASRARQQGDARRARSAVAIRLAAAIDESPYNKSQIARVLAGPTATKSQVEAQRRLLLKWLGTTQPGVGSAKRLSDIFGRPADYFLGVDISEEVADAIQFASEAKAKLRPEDNEAKPLRGSLNKAEIVSLFPHFEEHHLFIDAVQEIAPGESAHAIRFSDSHDNDLFWREDIVPGYVLTEALAQTAAIALLAQPTNRDRVILCAALNNVRFRHVLHAKEHEAIHFHATIVRMSAAIAIAEVEATAGDLVAVRGKLTLSIS